MVSNEFLFIFYIIFFIALIFLIPVFVQRNFYEINVSNFKKIKLKKFKFMFRATGGRSVSKDGVVKSLLYLQISGYVIAFLTMVANIALILLDVPLITVTVTTTAVLFIQALATIVTMITLTIISNKIDKRNGTTDIQNKEMIIKAIRDIKNKKKTKKEK